MSAEFLSDKVVGAVMDAVYSSKIGELQRCVKRINPIYTVLGVYLDTLLDGDLVNASAATKQQAKKKYLEWCKKNHLDKNVDEDKNVDDAEDAVFFRILVKARIFMIR